MDRTAQSNQIKGLHRDVRDVDGTVGFAGFVNSDDVRVLQSCASLRFPEQAIEILLSLNVGAHGLMARMRCSVGSKAL